MMLYLGTHVSVQSQLAERLKGEVGMRPDLGHVEDIPPILFGLVRGHDLGAERPARVFAPFDCVPHVDGVVFRFFAGQFGSLLKRHALNALVGLEMELHVDE